MTAITPKRARVLALLLVILAFAQDASAWGPRTRRVITMGALQVIRTQFAVVFKAGKFNYEADLLRGATDGLAAIKETVPMHNDGQALGAVAHEIALLRTVREYGAGSYFAYRMGTFSVLLSNILLPFAIPYSEADVWLGQDMQVDIDAHADNFSFAPRRTSFHYIGNPAQYYAHLRTFYPDDLKLISDDYAQGRGFGGFLDDAVHTYFQKSLEATVDGWYSVLRPEGASTDVIPSSRIVAWYFVEEIGYLLMIKNNFSQAERVYGIFQDVEPGLVLAYEKIGDFFYAYGTQKGRDRGVHEWKLAQRDPGPQRPRISRKLASHYLEVGEGLYRKANGPYAGDTDLQEALLSFQAALEYERTNDLVADRINETAAAITARRERYEMQQKILDKVVTVAKQAENSKADKDFANAFTTYNQALNLLDAVDSEFKDLDAFGKENRDRIRKDLRKVVNGVFEEANEHISIGDDAVDNRKYDDAIAAYSRVKEIVAAIDSEEGSTNAQRKREFVRRSENKIAQAENTRRNQQKQRKQAKKPKAGEKKG